jgi:hypothetical protein
LREAAGLKLKGGFNMRGFGIKRINYFKNRRSLHPMSLDFLKYL